MARETLKSFLNNVLGSQETSISYNIDATAGGEASRFDEGDDLGEDPNTGKKLLEGLTGDYVKFVERITVIWFVNPIVDWLITKLVCKKIKMRFKIKNKAKRVYRK